MKTEQRDFTGQKVLELYKPESGPTFVTGALGFSLTQVGNPSAVTDLSKDKAALVTAKYPWSSQRMAHPPPMRSAFLSQLIFISQRNQTQVRD